MQFDDRRDAGRQLATALDHLRGDDVIVLGLPRGGVPVAAEVAHHLQAPLDVLLVRKVGVPFQPELAMGAIGEGGIRVYNDEVIRQTGVSAEEWSKVEHHEWEELDRRSQALRGPHPRLALEDKVAIVIDDGLATGSTARAACAVARQAGARRVVLAVPVAPSGWTHDFENEADELIALATPEPFRAVGLWYRNFDPIRDDEVESCLSANAAAVDRHAVAAMADTGLAAFDSEVSIAVDGLELGGHLTIPSGATGVVIFAHGSGSSRHSPRNQFVASVLTDAGFGTLLFDLLTESEAADRRAVFDIETLAERLAAATDWLRVALAPQTADVGYFGASTGAAAALVAAADSGTEVAAVVSRGGRPDLAGAHLGRVAAPTLLIVGGRDDVVLGLNREAQQQLRCPSDLVVIPGATHLFEEPGTLEAAAAAARDWFAQHLTTPATA